MSFRFLAASDSAVIVEFGDTIDRAVSDRVVRLATAIRHARIEGVTDVVATFRSLMIHYDSSRITGEEIEHVADRLAADNRIERRRHRLWRIPVCYEPSYAPDLAEIAERTRMAPAELAALHRGVRYHVYMIGFMPGFPYMGDLPRILQFPRRADPRTHVPPGSVAIATSLTAIYPNESPGGWHLIGTTPVKLFDAQSDHGALLHPGDSVLFDAVSEKEFEAIAKLTEQGTYRPSSEDIAA